MLFRFDRPTRGSFGPQYRNKALVKAATHGFGNLFNINRFNTPMDNLTDDSVLESWLPTSPIQLNKLFRTIHKFDSIAGPAVDLISIMPFSDVTLIGVDDPAILRIYEETVNELRIETLLPEIAKEYLVIGRVICSLLFNSTRGIWTDVVIQDPDCCELVNIPLRGYDPKINLKVSRDFREFLASRDPRDEIAKDEIPKDLLAALESSNILPLDPVSTLYLSRKLYPNDFMGSSIYNRILSFYALEKSLVNGTLVAAKRRLRSILHISVGETDLWEPDEDDISTIAGMFMQADEDPVGAIVATRNGIETNEVRNGGDFWKISDEWDFLSTAKMRALGINEAFLTGEATYNCVVGDSLIPTEKGILRIDSIAEGKERDIKDINLVVGSRYGEGRAVKWLNNGIADVLHLETDLGNSIECTPKHAFLVLRGSDLVWVEAKDIEIGDEVCINNKPIVRKDKLMLNLEDEASLGNRPRGDITKPEYMTPELAYIMGCLVSEGSCGGADVKFYNGDIKYIEKYRNCIKEVFGLDTTAGINTHKGTKKIIKGKATQANRDCYQILACHQTLVNWLDKLGIEKNIHASEKIIPWCILQADEESQLAFLAAYLEGDGSVKKGGVIRYWSSSKELLEQLQVMLNAHGICSKLVDLHRDNDMWGVVIGNVDSFNLWNRIKQYVVSKEYPNKDYSEIVRKGYGFSSDYVRGFLEGRKIKANRMGVVFKTDIGEELVVKNWSKECVFRNKMFLYDNYKLGKYDVLLDVLRKVSEIEYKKLIILLKNEYRFAQICIKDFVGKKAVYDLSMEKGTDPVYVSCCFLTHNTMEVALSIFIESLRNFRDILTNQIFYEKLFPTLAEIHGFKKRTQAELSHRIRIGGKAVSSNLIIPEMNYHKQLRPEADADYLEVLATMEEKIGVLPLRTWAAAGGLNLKKILDMKDEDVKERHLVKKWKDESESIGGESEEEKEEGGAWGSADDDSSTKVVRNSLDSLPIWIRGKFLGVSKSFFISLLKSNNPKAKLLSKYKDDPKSLAVANYVLKRMGIDVLPFDVSAAKDISKHFKKCSAHYSKKRIKNEFIVFNRIIKNKSNCNAETAETVESIDSYIPKKFTINNKKLYTGE